MRSIFVFVLAVLLGGAATSASAQDVPHVDFQEGAVSARYRNVQNSAGFETADQLEDRIAFRARVNADDRGRLALTVGVFSGASLGGGWNNTGVGRGTRTMKMSVKQFYASLLPVRAVEAQVGSLYVERGENTEITNYDNDAYLTGERVVLRAPRYLAVDSLSVTNAYLGDLSTPNAFRRFDSLGRANYQQVLAQKRLAGWLAVSGDWSRPPEGVTWRGGVRVTPFGSRATLRLEGYRRERDPGGGFAITADAHVLPRLTVNGGYASVDARFPLLNGDRYGRGRRVFAGANVQVLRALMASAFYTHALPAQFPIPTERRWEAIATYNVLAAVRQVRGR